MLAVDDHSDDDNGAPPKPTNFSAGTVALSSLAWSALDPSHKYSDAPAVQWASSQALDARAPPERLAVSRSGGKLAVVLLGSEGRKLDVLAVGKKADVDAMEQG